MEKGFWHYLKRWRKIFSEKRGLVWRDTWLENGYCKDCRYCCGPQDSPVPFPMALLASQSRPDLEKDFHLLDARTAYLGADGCKSDTARGCRLPLEKRPVACGLFPIVLVNGRLRLYQNCPAALFTPLAVFEDMALGAAKMLHNFDLEDLRHISIDLPLETLASKYIDLHIVIFDSNGKKEICE